jgi:hypothetical protein
MADHLVVEHDHRDAVALRQIECAHRLLVHLGDGRWDQHDDRVIPMGTPAGLHDVALRRARGQSRARPRAHDIDDHARDLGVGRVADMFLHEREPRAAGGGHGLLAGQGGAEDRSHGGELVLHLHEDTAERRQERRHGLATPMTA